jgi:hypothetical protein
MAQPHKSDTISPFTLIKEDLMRFKFLGVMTGAVLLVAAGAANAKGPLMTDAQLDSVTAGTGSNLDFSKYLNSTSNNNVNFTADSHINDTFYKAALIQVYSQVYGNSASLGFDNEAAGHNSNVQGTFSQIAIAGQGSSQSGLFVAAANR